MPGVLTGLYYCRPKHHHYYCRPKHHHSSQQFASWLTKSSIRELLLAASFIFSPLISLSLSAQKIE